MHQPIRGSFVALPTPFSAGRLDLEALEGLIDRLACFPVDGLLIAGTTGEVSTLNDYEHRSLIHAAVDFNRGRMSLMAGIGTNCTRTSVELARFAASSGVDSLMAVTPYYNRPGRRGILLHYGQIAEATSTPLVLYNVPGRTGLDLKPDLVAEIGRRHPSVVAIKDASGSTKRVAELVATTNLAVLCGDDQHLAESYAAGALGSVSVVANLAPMHVAGIMRHGTGGNDPISAKLLQHELDSLTEGLALDVNPVPIKTALAKMGLIGADVRAPLAPMLSADRARLFELMETSPALIDLEAVVTD
ncbi:MAG TPA: 4-hydroxy-tetrahydrodipicolinate synthase [Planctomycetes bacterium]|jgi:4-hydroxy-tetrahydrodipicolinate synthase|nr:4-hydroxy-tetrahydrodipicolinate synthase [Planctomycetota bacterium]HIL52734.1 4-hydroxy-tetrahydrodipicolinate synthase [Planctomycetota bacterium]